MTTPLSDQPSTAASRIYGVATLVAPLLLLASTVAYLTDGDGLNDGSLGGTIGVWSTLAFALAFIGLYRNLDRYAPTAAPILLAVAVIGSAAGLGFNIDAILAAEFGRDAVDTASEDPSYVLLAYLPWGLFFPAGLVATGTLLWRAKACARASAALLIVGGVLFVMSRPARIDPLAVAADCALVLALAPIGWSILTRGRAGYPTPAIAPAAPA